MNRPGINADRPLDRLRALGNIGRDGDGRLARLAASDADRLGRDAAAGRMREAGLEVLVDRIGNLFGPWRAGPDDAADVFGPKAPDVRAAEAPDPLSGRGRHARHVAREGRRGSVSV